MNETASIEATSTEPEKPVQLTDVKFPPFPEPTDNDFEEDITEEERNFYKHLYKDLNKVKNARLHCTACDRHLGCSVNKESLMRVHPMLRTLVCQSCHTFYNSGEFEKGDDGSELYCRWCGQGGQVYCCSDCPHVFCAKCIKRNLGMPKIKEIENTDDWKCFKCDSKCLWNLRAVCWALLRYCDLKNKIIYETVDPVLKEIYQKDCRQDHTECCKHKMKRKEKLEALKKKENENVSKKSVAASVISKIPPTIQVKKFASINLDNSPKQEKKSQKRPASPKNNFFRNSAAIPSCSNINSLNLPLPPMPKKIRIPNSPVGTYMRMPIDKRQITYTRVRPKGPQVPIPIMSSNQFNGFNNMVPYNNNSMLINDNINLSLDSLTQGLDMSAVVAMANRPQNDELVCTPDFPLEPMCEVTEDNDDDVECITPGPVAAPKVSTPPPLAPRIGNTIPDLCPENIIQMTENDVTVNAATGGLKFRVDPQTLSSNKMYRLPDGRIFAINANPNMPGGYSATIVAVTETTGKAAPKGATYAAKLSAITSSQTPVPPPLKVYRTSNRNSNSRRNTPNISKVTRGTATSSARECDLNVPVEWYRYNLIDAVDALEYSLSRLQKLKKDTTTMYLRSRSVSEMRQLHRTLERLLNTSSNRFKEIRDNLNKGLKQYLSKKKGENNSEDDDDVEILPDMDDNDDPIFIDENSIESNSNGNETQEVDLTELGSSEQNDSGEKSMYKDDNDSTINDSRRDLSTDDLNNENSDVLNSPTNGVNNLNDVSCKESIDDHVIDKLDEENPKEDTHMDKDSEKNENLLKDNVAEENEPESTEKEHNETNGVVEKVEDTKEEGNEDEKQTDLNDEVMKDKVDNQDDQGDEKLQDSEMSEEMIETLLKDDDVEEEPDSTQNVNCLNVAEVV